MTPEQQLIQQISQLLASGQLDNRALLEDLSMQFSELCRSANERLARCGDYLEKGRRSEAVYEAHVSPDLIELAQWLADDGLRKWNNVCLDLELTAASPLDMTIVERLRQASDNEAALGPLLKEYRRCVYQSDHVRCIELLRKIREKDTGNPSWIENLRPLEESYLPYWLEQAEKGLAENNLANLKVVFNELNHPMRVVKAPDDLMKQLRRALLSERTIDLKAEGNSLMSKLKIAMEEGDSEQMEKLWAECGRLEEDEAFLERPANWSRIISDSHARVEELAKAKEKAAEFAAALSVLKDMLMENKASSLDIRHAYERLESWKLPIPELVTRQVKELLEQRQKVVRHRARVLTSSAVLAIVILLAVVGGVLYWLRIQQYRNDMLAKAHQFADNKDYDELAVLMETVKDEDTTLFNSPELVGMRNDMENDKRLLEEKSRTYQMMKATLEEIRRADYRGDEESIRRTLSDAQASAVAEEEKEYVVRWKNEWVSFKSNREVQVDDRLQPQLNVLSERLGNIRKGEGDALAAEQEELDKLHREFMKISLTDVSQASGGMRERYAQLKGGIESRMADCRRRGAALEAERAKEREQLAAVAGRLGSLRRDIPMALPNFERYAELLQEFVDKGKGAPETHDYQNVIGQLPEYKMVPALQGFNLGETLLGADVMKKVKASLADGAPAASSVWRSDLERLARMNKQNSEMRNKVRSLIALKKSNLYVLRYRRRGDADWQLLYSERPFQSQQKDGTVYYWGDVLWAGDNDTKVSAIASANLNHGENITTEAFEVRYAVLKDDNLAPHVVLLKRLVMEGQRTEDVALYLMREMIALRENGDLDPVQKMQIFKKLANILAVYCADELPEARYLMMTANTIDTNIPWQRADHPLTIAARAKIQEFWGQIPPLPIYLERLEWNRRLLRAVLRTELRCVGSVQLDSDGAKCFIPRERGNELWMYVPAGGGQIPTFRMLTSDGGALTAQAMAQCPVGMPVFAPLAGHEVLPVWEGLKEKSAELVKSVVLPQTLPVNLK